MINNINYLLRDPSTAASNKSCNFRRTVQKYIAKNKFDRVNIRLKSVTLQSYYDYFYDLNFAKHLNYGLDGMYKLTVEM